MKLVLKKRKDIVFFIKLFPLTKIHPYAYKKAKAIVCAKSLKMLERAFDGKKLPEPSCDTDIIDANIEIAKRLGINGTPRIILADGSFISCAINADVLIEQIDKVIQNKN